MLEAGAIEAADAIPQVLEAMQRELRGWRDQASTASPAPLRPLVLHRRRFLFAIVDDELEAFGRLRREIEITSASGCLAATRQRCTRIAWYLWLDRLIAWELKECFLKCDGKLLRHFIAGKEVLVGYRRKIVPLLEEGWSWSYESACKEIERFLELLSADTAGRVLARKAQLPRIGIPQRDAWVEWQEVVNFADSSAVGSARAVGE